MAQAEHLEQAKDRIARCAILTVSDTRTTATDKTGPRIGELLEIAGHLIVHRYLLPNDLHAVRDTATRLLRAPNIDVIVATGGTGISQRDQTVDALQPLVQYELPGFGELFRALSFAEIGSSAILSRAFAAVASGKLIFALPGSLSAVELAMNRLIVPELRHLLDQLKR